MKTLSSSTLLGTLFLLLLTLACSQPQEPIYKGFEGLKANTISTKRITLSGEAVYHNPNAFGGEVVSTDIQVIVNDVPAATIQQEVSIPVPATAEFRLPLTCNVSPKEIYENDRNGALGGIINAVLTRKVDVQYKGEIVVKIAGINFSTPIDYEEEVEIK